jgi:hypothetical protein
MQIQVNTDDSVEGRDALLIQVEAAVEAALGRFGDQLTRVEVHLSDVNSGRGGSEDKRCMMEARPAGQQPVAVTHNAASLVEAYEGAAGKLQNLLQSRFGKLNNTKGAPSIRDNDLR